MTNEESYISFDSVTDVPRDQWYKRWPNFSPHEIVCKKTGHIFLQIEAMDKLQKMRDVINAALHIEKACCQESDREHIYGRAFDIKIRGGKWGAEEMKKAALMVGFTGIGLYDTFIHVDNRPFAKAEWDMRGKNGQA